MQILSEFFFCKTPLQFLEFLCDSNALFGLSVDPQNQNLFEFKVSRGYPKISSEKKPKSRDAKRSVIHTKPAL